MYNVIKFENLGHNRFGWLDARHHFSFGRYYNPDRMGFKDLRVINDDIVAANTGFDPHPHDNMEIITYVRKGAITHKDSMGNEGRTAAGDIQVMSAGTGVTHSEYNLEDEETKLYQIWIMPNEQDVAPRWEAKSFPKQEGQTELSLLVSGDKNDSDALFIHADAKIYGGVFKEGQTVTHPIPEAGYLLVSSGEVSLDGQTLQAGDGVEITKTDHITLAMLSDAEILVINLKN
ncbi:MAG: hypothetical protein CMH30_03430 [Micavibrio sp.]|nr:hypothetical protein [Micavibrio sp.]